MRVENLSADQLDSDQKKLYDDIMASPRGRVEGPHKVWLHSPHLGDHAQRLGAYCRFGSALPPRLSELAICVTGRFWCAHYEWYVHAPLAIKAGISEDIITAIRENRQPSFVEEDEQLVHDISLVLHRDHRIPDDLYRRGTEVLGTKAMVDLVGLLGYYTLISMTLNAFDVQLPGDAVSDL